MNAPVALRFLRARHHLWVVALALLLALWRMAGLDPFTSLVEDRLLDLRFQLRGSLPSPSGVVIVALDEAAVGRFPGIPERRRALARAVDRIAAAEPAAVAIDLLLVERSGADGTLAEALSRTPDLVLSSALVGRPAGGSSSSEQREVLERSLVPVVLSTKAWQDAPGGALLMPTPQLAGTGYLGHVNIIRSPDRLARRLPLAVPLGGGRFLPALPLTAVGLALDVPPAGFALALGSHMRLGVHQVPTGEEGAVVLNHLGGAGTIEAVGMLDLLDGRTDPERLRGRLVFVGSTAQSLRDSYATPFSSDTAGVEILATAAANLLAGNEIRRDEETLLASALLAALLAILALRAGAARAPWLAASALAGTVFGAAVLLQLAFAELRLWLDAVTVLGGVAVGGAISLFSRQLAERRLSTRLSAERQNLARYVSPALAEALAGQRKPSFDRRQIQAAVLFVDVAGFTAMSERSTPVDVAAFLNELHGAFEDVAASHGGLIVDFLGDGALIVFGLPEPGPGDAAAALACAEELCQPGAVLSPDGAPVILRATVHYGPVAIAVLGGRRQGQVSVTGDTVNVASRLQDFAKQAGAALVTTRQTLEAAALEPAAAGYLRLGREPMRGRRTPVEIFGAPPRRDAARRSRPPGRFSSSER